MPIERELKYVLRPTTEVADQLLRLHRNKGWQCHLIEQAYIASGARIRRKTPFIFPEMPDKTNPEHTFTYKHDLPDFSVVEMECPITDFDFDCMWTCAETRLTKVRYSKKKDTGEQWDIDVFILSVPQLGGLLEPYCIVAECELPHGVVLPAKLPGVVNRNLIHRVRPGDKGFASKQIADHEKITSILEVLQEIADAYYA